MQMNQLEDEGNGNTPAQTVDDTQVAEAQETKAQRIQARSNCESVRVRETYMLRRFLRRRHRAGPLMGATSSDVPVILT